MKMDEKKLMMEAKILKSFLNDFNHIPEMDKLGDSADADEKPAMLEVEISKDGEEPKDEDALDSASADDMADPKAKKPLIDKMLRG